MANDHPKFEENVPQFSGNINGKFVEWTDVKLWEADHKEETKPRLGTEEDFLDSQSRSSRHCLVRETQRTLCR